MRAYVENAVTLIKSSGNAINNQVLKEAIHDDHPWIGRIPWRIVNEPLKDEPMQDGNICIPLAQTKMWYWNPSIGILMLWVTETLSRHEREVIRVLEALQLPRYASKRQAQNALPVLKRLHRQIKLAIDAIEGQTL